MNLTDIAKIILLVLLIVCAISVNFTKTLLQAVIIFAAYSSMMCIIWILMESPDLAITEAAVGAGISGTLFLLALRRIREEDDMPEDSELEEDDSGAAQKPDYRVVPEEGELEEDDSGAAQKPDYRVVPEERELEEDHSDADDNKTAKQ